MPLMVTDKVDVGEEKDNKSVGREEEEEEEEEEVRGEGVPLWLGD